VEAKQKGVKLAAHYSKFVDLISEFSRTYPRLAKLGGGGVGSTSLHKMADQLDVTIGETERRSLMLLTDGIGWGEKREMLTSGGGGRGAISDTRHPGRELRCVPHQQSYGRASRGGACLLT